MVLSFWYLTGLSGWFSIECRKAICVYFGFVPLRSVIGWPISHHFLNQWEAKPIVICSHAFSRAWHRFHAFVSNSDWLTIMLTSVVIGQCRRAIILVLAFRHSIDGLYVTSWRPCWCTGTIRFFSSYFYANCANKFSFVLYTNMAAIQTTCMYSLLSIY